MIKLLFLVTGLILLVGCTPLTSIDFFFTELGELEGCIYCFGQYYSVADSYVGREELGSPFGYSATKKVECNNGSNVKYMRIIYKKDIDKWGNKGEFVLSNLCWKDW